MDYKSSNNIYAELEYRHLYVIPCIQLIQLRLTSTIVKWQMCNMHEHRKIIYGNNIVLNKSNTSAVLLDYKYSIYSMIFFTFACNESSFFWHSIDHIAHLTIADVNLN